MGISQISLRGFQSGLGISNGFLSRGNRRRTIFNRLLNRRQVGLGLLQCGLSVIKGLLGGRFILAGRGLIFLRRRQRILGIVKVILRRL